MREMFLTDPGRISVLPRWCHKLFAHALGFFWLPCPACGEMFGGHEWRDPSVQTDPVTKKGCCPRHRRVIWDD